MVLCWYDFYQYSGGRGKERLVVYGDFGKVND